MKDATPLPTMACLYRTDVLDKGDDDARTKTRTVKTPCRFGFTKRIPEPDNVVQWCPAVG